MSVNSRYVIDGLNDLLQDYQQVQDLPQKTTTEWQGEFSFSFSSSSSFSNFTGEVEFVEDLSRIGCMSPYSNYASYNGNEDLIYEDYDQTNSLNYPNLF